MVLGRPKTYAKKVVKKWSPPKGSRPKKKPKLSKIPPWGPTGVFWIVLDFFLGRLPFGGDHFLTTFLAYVLGRPKTIILQFLGFGLSRGHGLYKARHTDLVDHTSKSQGLAGWARKNTTRRRPQIHF